MPGMVHNKNNNSNEVKERIKKGPWTPVEDAILKDYVMKYGEGNWNYVPMNSGLARCGKSCRLRWANHLRPNLRKGKFSKEEEHIIVQLHAKLGNKWARMATQLPGRSDNEIKNFWNSRMKRRKKAGLPLYPLEIQHEANEHNIQQIQYFTQPHPSPSLSFYSFLSSPNYPQELNENSVSSSNANSQCNEPNLSCYTNTYSLQFKFHNGEENECFGNINLPLTTISPDGYSSFNQCFAANESHDYYSSTAMIESPEWYFSLTKGSNIEVSSSQLPPDQYSTSASSNTSGVYGFMETTMNDNGNITNKNQRTDLGSSQFKTGNKLIVEDSLEGMHPRDDDLFSMLNYNFRSEMSTPSWYHHSERQSLGLETQYDALSIPIGQEFAGSL